MDGRVFLARRLGADLDAGIEDFLARHHQFGPPATEQFREKSPKMVVDRIERCLLYTSRCV